MSIVSTETKLPISLSCSYCSEPIVADSDQYLECLECHGYVEIKCLRHASTPGDILGDVFFDFTCAKCMQLQYDGPSTSSRLAREKFIRQRLSWLMVLTLTIYNLSVKAKGLSNQGYFHWRTHITNFIDKNWDYLFGPCTRRRKRWVGSVAGVLSHNSPEFFLSGAEDLSKSGWWKLTHANLTPKCIYKLFEQSRAQPRDEKRAMEDTSSNVTSSPTDVPELKRVRLTKSEEDAKTVVGCSRTIPYMGRKPKLAKQLNIVDVDNGRNMQQQQQQQQQKQQQQQEQQQQQQQHQPLNTVQSSLMDFLAENLGVEDLTMFSNMESEPLVSEGRNDFLSLIEAHNENANFPYMTGSKDKAAKDLGIESSLHTTDTGKFKRPEEEHIDAQKLPAHSKNFTNGITDETLQSESECSSSTSDDDEYQPRIVQVTNFQERDGTVASTPLVNNTDIKTEMASDNDEPNSGVVNAEEVYNTEDSDRIKNEDPPPPRELSLFTRQPRRNWPWLVQKNAEDDEQELPSEENDLPDSLVMMSEYEERELLHKLRKIFSLETKCKLHIPSYVRRFYRKLCVREWKREHARAPFNLDEHLDGSRHLAQTNDSYAKILDRYQLISLSSREAHKSFYARIAGSFQYELFESPYTQRVLHPFIYRNTKCFPPWLKLMCEMKYAVNGVAPNRAPVDFCYVRPNHISAVNALLQSLFWSGIDMTECLSYPDFSVIALYKKLVVGCGFLVPDVGFNEAYISFLGVRPSWQRSGIASFMLYHLIQTCMSKDITLHVSATNPAVMLYQKFGFKIEEVIQNFYEKYLPLDSTHSRHAFFLRLAR